jgi:trehalose 6-phosphate phosphatase
MPSNAIPTPSPEKPLHLLLDYDGTLSPIVSNPEEARLNARGLDLLKRLAEHPSIKVAVISGRSVEQLEGFLGSLFPVELTLCGLHGGQIWSAQSQEWLFKLDERYPEALAPFKRALLNKLEEKQATDQGVFIEDKGYSLAVHTRNVASDELKAFVEQAVESLYRTQWELSELFRFQAGKAVLELVPKACHKGKAVEFLVRQWGTDASYVYIGDDLTDEAGFKEVNKLNGLSLHVVDNEPRETDATHEIESVEAVHKLLEQWLEARQTAKV